MPRALDAPFVERNGPVREMPVTGYTLALSWAPEYCKGRENRRRDALQCSGKNGRFGFVVHGLWPDSGRTWPQWCPTRQNPTGTEIARQLCLSPSARLVARQWAKHGSCMTRRPETYFKVTRILWNSLRWPDYDRISREDGLTAGDIRKAFVDANPGWREDAVGVRLNDRGWLEELRLCYSRRFRPIRCDKPTFGAGNTARAKIWRGL
ncbi:ribonuclease T2 [Altererythrobacter xiamenensis]|uniref:Ribonuclease T2 n=1 Tax=Altererythrobacter xiamenensis TaxID=1316679 RepID=A0A1Y6F248_9SPHN|nr:ribonuclease T [Altererythrobacter xiamenensis]SMQ68915.1 ribonuclease T2 [Altererythrobacter xiamenensis]